MAGDELETVLLSLSGVFDGEEPVDELSHALQCAQHAIEAGAEPDLVAAALFHDVARSPLVGSDEQGVPHERIAARWLAPRFGERVAWLAGAHVAAKLYLLETEPSYEVLLSPESVKTAGRQQLVPEPVPIGHPWWPDAVLLRRWDDAAKRVDAVLPDIADLLSVVARAQLR